MALFGKSSQPSFERSGTTVIASGSKVEGLIQSDCDLHVDGLLVGEVHCSGEVSIGGRGRIEGQVYAQRFVITGSFEGQADCDEVEIMGTGHAAGEIASHILVVERGSQFEGRSRQKSSEELKQSLSRDDVKALPLDSSSQEATTVLPHGGASEEIVQAEMVAVQKPTPTD
ncbi:bactofilin family protein [Magnetococcus sp. PR-3]|uniref:bactofilin family protein n=1 Tax=Magnetococcus sp. PR-3 TaxID=3120355 RepID=UPI002FCE4A12